MLLNLVIAELENLESIREGCLSGSSLSEIVDYLLVWESLLNVVIVKVHYRIARGPNFPPYSITEDHFFFPVVIETLDLTIL
jgi:hypothetical protein